MNFDKDLNILNIGLSGFTRAFENTKTKYTDLNWSPPEAPVALLKKMDSLKKSDKVREANSEAFERLNAADPALIGVRPARDVIKTFKDKIILHAGPPVNWEDMCGPVKGAVIGAVMYEGWAESAEKAAALCSSGEISFDSCHHHNAVGPMAGILSPSMYVWEVKNSVHGNTAYCSLNEGLGKVLRFGANDSSVLNRLKWMQNTLGPGLSKALEFGGPLNIFSITGQAIQMGDECHNRNVAATSILLNKLTPMLLETSDKETALEIIKFISTNPHFYLNLSMAACKAVTDTISGLKNCTLISAMARNGTEIGVRVAGCGDKWFTFKAGIPAGLFFSGFTQKDANPDLGDSTVSEIAGIGANAMAAAPAIVKFVGGTPADALNYTREMYEITYGQSRKFQIPQLNFAGTPLGTDILRIIDSGVLPIINTGIAHREPGIGQVGAGLLRAPMDIFTEALEYFEVK